MCLSSKRQAAAVMALRSKAMSLTGSAKSRRSLSSLRMRVLEDSLDQYRER